MARARGESLQDLLDGLTARPDSVVERSLAATLSAVAVDAPVNLAALFDLLVADEYYKSADISWYYCPMQHLLYAPFTNVCPGCLEADEFHFVKGNKPNSGSIGTINAAVLRGMLTALAQRNVPSVELMQPREPFDLLLWDRDSNHVFGAEIKAAPLMTLPLAASPSNVSRGHVLATPPSETDRKIVLPAVGSDRRRLVPLHTSRNGLLDAATSAEGPLAKHYLAVWSNAFEAYSNSALETRVRWLTNACGPPPRPLPAHWPKRARGKGFEVISDGKSSVGLDRTDDIKKALAQTLVSGVQFGSSSAPTLVRGIASNLPAIRHHDDYLAPFLDIVWGYAPEPDEPKPSSGQRLADPGRLNRLLDGIVTLAGSHIVDPWLAEVFGLD